MTRDQVRLAVGLEERSSPRACLVPARIALVVILSVTAAQSLGQDGEPNPSDGEMRQHSKFVRLESVAGGQSRGVELLPDSLLNFNDPAGRTLGGSLWAWGGPGRPLAVLELSKMGPRPGLVRWVDGVTSLSHGRIVATWEDGQRWQSTAPGLTMRPVPDAAVPAESNPERLRQMKAIARKFLLREATGPIRGKIQLRLLPNPIHRYSDAGSGQRDGAVFVFASGTNPEALLVVEAQSAGRPDLGWHYGLARVTGGALAADMGGREVWRVEEADPPHAGPAYMNRFHPPVQPK